MTERTTEPNFGSSLKWQSVNVVVQVILQLVFIAILARLIPTDAFGIMAIALVVVGFIEIFAQVGIGPSLIQSPEVTKEHRKTAFAFSLLLGVIFFIGVYFTAPIVADFYEEPLLTEVLRWIALSFIISGASVVPRSMLIKDMKFKSLFFCSGTAMIIGNLIIGLTLAYNGAGIWAYVVSLLAQNTLLSIGYWIAYPGPAGFTMNRTALKDMLGYGSRSTLFNLLNYAASKVDTAIIGASTSNWTLTGFYDRSSYLMGLPVTVLGKLSDSVLFSGMSMMQDNKERLKDTVLSAIHAVTLIVIPLTGILVLRAEEFTAIILGGKYANAVPIVMVLFLCVGLRSFIKIGDAALRATDNLGVGALIKTVFLISLTVGVIKATSVTEVGETSIINAAWAVVAATSLQAVLIGIWIVRGLQIKISNLLQRLAPGFLLLLIVLVSGKGLEQVSETSLYGNNILPELAHTIKIATLILTSGFLAFITLVIKPNSFDGGTPRLRRKLITYLPDSKLKERLLK
jgi:O-antigen/teichoic acid export membrane protein